MTVQTGFYLIWSEIILQGQDFLQLDLVVLATCTVLNNGIYVFYKITLQPFGKALNSKYLSYNIFQKSIINFRYAGKYISSVFNFG